MPAQRTYWHLEHLKRRPTAYDVVSSRLLYHVGRGFEVRVPVDEWYRRHQEGSALTAGEWARFRDPRETTYATYTEMQKTKEIFVDGLLKAIDDTGYDRGLSPGWMRILERVVAPLRYPVHGLQMIAAYVAHLAPEGRITIAGLFQAADEVRRVQRLAYRMRQLQVTHAGFGESSRTTWQEDAVWQPWRQVIERLLVTYDWGEAFVALNLVLKPMFDELFMTAFGRLALSQGDDLLEKAFLSLREDCQWHRDWSLALVRTALAERADNGRVIAAWIERWHSPVSRAALALAPVFDEMPERPTPKPFAAVMAGIDAMCRDDWATAGLAVNSP
jgi:toluene monooxygenase system protein E